jgi:hypothetical protein
MKKQIENLTPEETKAIFALVSETAAVKASKSILVGDHPLNFTVHVEGFLRKGEDYKEQDVAKAEPWTLLLVALSHLNGASIESITREALTADPSLVENLKVAAKKALEAIKAPTSSMHNGIVTVDLHAKKI